MKCPYCNSAFYFEASGSWVLEYEDPEDENPSGFAIEHGFCPECGQLIVFSQDGDYYEASNGSYLLHNRREGVELLIPKGFSRPVEKEVPDSYRDDYQEAVTVLSISPKASAALSRRIMQHLLREECGVKHANLAAEIQEYITRDGIPSYLTNAIDAVRNVGNFAAHPMKDKYTDRIVDVEDGEAEWLLEVLDSMFDFTFVQPRRLEERKQRLNEKLKGMGKPHMKG